MHSGPELDLLLVHRGRRTGVEFKFADAPGCTHALRTACDDLKLERLWIVYPGRRRYPIADGIDALPLDMLPEAIPAPAS